jgi:aquaporin Z
LLLRQKADASLARALTICIVPRAAKVLTELVGTFIFVSVIALSGNAGSLAPLAVGSGLMAMVFMGAHISGAHYNPAVSLGVFLRRQVGAVEMLTYWAAQLVGAALAFVFGYLVSGHSPGMHPGSKVDVFQALAIEILFTAALVLVVLNVALTRATQGNSFYGIAIGFTIAAAIFVGGPISGGAYNPAVGIGATLGSAMFGGGGWSDVWLYIVGPLTGAAIGAGIHALQTGRDRASDP